MGEIKRERCLVLEGRVDGGVYACECVCVGVELPLALHDGVVR